MAQVAITHKTLGNLDNGSAGEAIDQAIREAVNDLDDRGKDGKPRKVEIILTLQQLDNGQVKTVVEANAKMPRRKTAGTIGRIARGIGPDGHPESGVQFSQYAPEDPHQSTID